jgi:hypothetical protein
VLVSSGSPNVVLLRDNPDSKTAVGTFDYNDLNAYLLLVVGIARPEEHQAGKFKDLAAIGREGKPIPIRAVQDLWAREEMVHLGRTQPLTKAVEIFGSGFHRILIVEEGSTDVIGVLTQLRMVEYFWENNRHFGPIEPLFRKTLREIDLGSQAVVSIK